MMGASRRSSRASSIRVVAENGAAVEVVNHGGNGAAAGGDFVDMIETQATPVDTQATIVTQVTIPDSQKTEADTMSGGCC